MRIVLETHTYAPELNRAYVGPNLTMIRAPGCTTIKQVREKLFKPLVFTGRHVTLSSSYPAKFAWLNRQRTGFCNDLRSLADAMRIFRQGLDHRQAPTLKVKTRLIG